MNTREEKITQIIGHIVMMFLAICSLLPFVLLIIASFTDNLTALRDGFSFLPKKWSTGAYQYILNEWATIGRAYGITVFVTVVGTTLSLFITSMLGYALTKKGLPGRGLLIFLVVFTLLFHGGLVPSYYVYSNIFHIKDTIWALIVPGLLMNGFTIILVKNYFTTNIPDTLVEAAKMDGANEFRIFFGIVLPLSLPILATIGLMSAIGYWNDWTNGLYYLTDSKLFSIQNVMNKINENVNFLANNSQNLGGTVNAAELPSTTIRMAIAAVGILPILIAYPFFQKYFVKGITIGAVKE